jgi:hypothetical protein
MPENFEDDATDAKLKMLFWEPRMAELIEEKIFGIISVKSISRIHNKFSIIVMHSIF